MSSTNSMRTTCKTLSTMTIKRPSSTIPIHYHNGLKFHGWNTNLSCSRTMYTSILPLEQSSTSSTIKDNEDNKTNTNPDFIPPIVMREVGPCRSVFLLKAQMSSHDWKDLSERLLKWGHNESLNSVLVTSQDPEDIVGKEDGSILPLGAQFRMVESISKSDLIRPQLNSPWDEEFDVPQRHVLLGLDPLVADESSYEDIMAGISSLSLTMTNTSRKTPIIVCPNGFVSDGGLAFFLSQYVLATPYTSFRIDHPTRGLSFDPCGISYVLPRLGIDMHQKETMEYASTISKLLAFTGFEANGYDLISVGLATHYVQSLNNIPLLETALSQIPSFQDQGLLPPSTRSQHQWIQETNRYLNTGERPEDVQNKRFRNVAVHNLMEDVSVALAGKDDFFSGPVPPKPPGRDRVDAAFEEEDIPLGAYVDSPLLNIAATFHPIFEEETNSIHGIMERLKELVHASNMDPEVVQVSSYLLEGMQKRSPLALRAMEQLLTLGQDADTTIEDCIQRETLVQKHLLAHDDFQKWRKQCIQNDVGFVDDPKWMHEGVESVTDDEVQELFQPFDS